MHTKSYYRIRTAVRTLIWGGMAVVGYALFLAACAGYTFQGW